jgi:beta-glucosidase-like glycosyl hydrolase/CubicO group peptidase (beta-lactamase class C family)
VKDAPAGLGAGKPLRRRFRARLAKPSRFVLLAPLLTACAAAAPETPVAPPPATPAGPWAERTLAAMTLREKVGQMLMPIVLADYAPEGSAGHERVVRMIDSLAIGGLIVSVGTPTDAAVKLNSFQSRSRIPLLIAADLETGAGFRLRGAVYSPNNIVLGGATEFPPLMALGATGSAELAYEMGRVTALEARAVGIHVPFAPVLDVNSNPDNPIINVRSLGEDPERVAELGAALVRGIQENGALATAKHFPGHGDTETDSHVGLPVIRSARPRLEAVELLPFRRAVDAGIGGVMTAHIAVEALTGDGDTPATLAPRVMTDLLRRDMRFDGLLFTDALDMAAIDSGYPRGEAAVRAVQAGADVLLMPPDVRAASDAVVAAVGSGRIAEARIDASVRRILAAKERFGLHQSPRVSADDVVKTVGIPAHVAVAEEIAQRSITLLENEGGVVPLTAPADAAVLSVTYRRANDQIAGRYLDARLRASFPRLASQTVERESDPAVYERLLERARGASLVVVSLYVTAVSYQGTVAVAEPAAAFIKALASERIPHVVISFGNPYLLREFPGARAYLLGWGSSEVSQRAVARALLGEVDIGGRTPTRIPPLFEIGAGAQLAARPALDAERRAQVAAGLATPPAPGPAALRGDAAATGTTTGPDRFLWGHPTTASFLEVDPATVGMSADALARVDSIVLVAVTRSGIPGAALAVGRRGKLVRLRGYGWLDHDRARQVTPGTLYDMASLTKVVGTTTAVMLLEQEGRLSLDDRVVRWLPGWDRGDARKGSVTLRHLLTHSSGLVAGRPWYRDRAGRDAYRGALYDEPLANDPGTTTVYSDLGAITLGFVVEAVTGQPLDAFLEARVFGPLAMDDTGFRPDSAVLARVAPTELDTLWRKELVRGRVHDENADALGGVAGHAGLFSTAFDAAVFTDMMLRLGVAPPCRPEVESGSPCTRARADSLRLVRPDLVSTYTKRQSDASSRGLGWDTPEGRSSAGDYFSAASFGHTGFTGTSIWIDPEQELYVVLLTNRVNPTRANQAHIELRRAVHDAVALAITDTPVRPRSP